VDVPLSDVGKPTIPISNPAGASAVHNPYGIVFGGVGANGGGLFFTAPMDRAPDTGGGQAWAICLPANAAPTAILKVTPDHGPAPLTVTLDGSGSTDPDQGDSIVSYTFDFGDGSGIVTQSKPTITHTYQFAGEYPARLSVNDSRGLASTNVAIFPVEVNAALRNISTRGNVQTGDNLLIAGFIVTGNAPRNIVLRAIGPSIKSNGQPVPGTLQDPTLELHDGTGALIAKNDNWKTDDATGKSQQTAIQGTSLPPSDDRESAILKMLSPGQYTAIVRGKGNTTGIAVVEAYDLNPFATSKLANISTRGPVASGDNVMIGGFVAGPQNAAPTLVLIRGIGPSLTSAGVPNALQDPTLELHDGNGNKVRVNDNWKDTQQADIQATGIPPKDSRESAILTEIAPGNYTAILGGKNGTGGNGLIEVYSIQ
jgi:PKD repeat protein